MKDDDRARVSFEMPGGIADVIRDATVEWVLVTGNNPKFLLMGPEKWQEFCAMIHENLTIVGAGFSFGHAGKNHDWYDGMIVGRTNQLGLYVCDRITLDNEGECIHFAGPPDKSFFEP